MIISNPLVSINLPTLNRKNDLREVLIRLREQSYHNMEVIVVDNNSTDGTPDMIREEFPEVKLICMPYNIGSIAGRNIAAKDSQGKYVLSIDDDSFPGRNAIGRMVEEFEKDEKLGLIAFGLLNYKQYWKAHEWRSLKDEVIPTNSKTHHDVIDWSGCGGGIRRDLFEKLGYWEEWGFQVMWERSFSVRILNADYKIKAFADVYVYHDKSEIGEPAKYKLYDEAYFTQCRSITLFYLKYYPFKWLLINLWHLIFAICYACVEKRNFVCLRGLFAALKMGFSALKQRQVLRTDILCRVRTPFNFKGR